VKQETLLALLFEHFDQTGEGRLSREQFVAGLNGLSPKTQIVKLYSDHGPRWVEEVWPVVCSTGEQHMGSFQWEQFVSGEAPSVCKMVDSQFMTFVSSSTHQDVEAEKRRAHEASLDREGRTVETRKENEARTKRLSHRRNSLLRIASKLNEALLNPADGSSA
jgi:hypothetical protein